MGFFKPNIEKMKARKDVKGLIKALKDKDKDVRFDAAMALGGIGGPAVEPLIQALGELGDEDVWIREGAAFALGKVGDARAIKPLIQASDDKYWNVIKEATVALRKIGKPAVEPLIQALKDEDSHFRKGAARALAEIGDARAVEPLIEALKNEDVRMQAAEALGKIGDARAVEPLIRMKPLKIYTILFRRPISPQEYAEGARQALGYGASAQVVGTPPTDETFAKNAIREVCGDIWSMSPVPEVKVEKGDPADFSARHDPTLPGGGLNDYAIDFLKHKIAEGKDPDYFNIAGYSVYVNTSVDRITGDGALIIHIDQ